MHMIIRHLAVAAASASMALTACTNGSSSRDASAPAAPVPTASTEARAPAEARRTRAAANTEPSGPPLDQMSLATAVGKIGVPVDVRYKVSGVVAKDQPATVQLAFVPRVAGSNLRVEFPETAGVAVDAGSGAVWAEKATTSDVFRRNVSVTPTAGDSGEMRAIVSMDFDGGRYFSVFSIPVGAASETASPKRPPKG